MYWIEQSSSARFMCASAVPRQEKAQKTVTLIKADPDSDPDSEYRAGF